MKKVTPFLIVFILSLSMVVFSKAEAAEFPDVQQYEEEIRYLTERGIIRGFPDGTFDPTNSLTRLQAVQMLLKAKGITDFTAPNPNLTDMFPGKYGYEEVAKAVQLGIISGKTAKDGSMYFDPSQHLTRGQMAKVIAEANSLPITQTTIFIDVPPSNGFHDHISSLATEGITGGYEDGTYRPTNTVSRQHFAVFVARMMDDKFKPNTEVNRLSFIPNKQKAYTWEYTDEGKVSQSTVTYSEMKYDGVPGWDLWRETVSDHVGYFIVTESENGLFEITCENLDRIRCRTSDEGPYQSLEYPLYVGKQWGSLQNQFDPTIYTVVSMNRTVNLRAGTFNNVVEVKDSNGWVYFYAPNVGLVKTIENGATFAELVGFE